MFNEKLKKQIIEVWNSYVSTIRTEKDEEGNPINNIDDSRLYAIEVVKIIMHNFLKGDFNVQEFKNALDSYNKHNNLWGFSAKFGQLYFNQLIKANEGNMEKLNLMLKDLITEPKNLRDALSKIDTLEKYTLSIYSKSKDKHNAPYPGAVGYFLSYFWQMYNHQKWPILYNTLLSSFKELGVWEDFKTQKETYENYYRVYNEIKDTVEDTSTKIITFWEIEHAFWNYKSRPVHEPYLAPKNEQQQAPQAQTKVAVAEAPVETIITSVADPIDIRDYVMPKLSRFLEHQMSAERSSDGSMDFAQLVSEAFKQLDFEVEVMVPGAYGPFAVAKFRTENIAFLIDATESSEYFQKDRRMVKSYVGDFCNDLKKEGYKKIGYFVVSNQFEGQHQDFISYIQWNTDIKKMTLISTEALLYLLAYKIKHRVALPELMEKLTGFPMLLSAQNIALELEN